MQTYYVKHVGDYGFIGVYHIDKDSQDFEAIYLADWYDKLGDSDGEGIVIYLSKFMAPYERVIKEKYPKENVESREKFDQNTKCHDWFPGRQPVKSIVKHETK